MSFMKYKYSTCYTEFKNDHKTECFLFDSISDKNAYQLATHSLPLNRQRIMSNFTHFDNTPNFMLQRKLKKACCGTKDCDLKIYDGNEVVESMLWYNNN